ncbi:hypothetical protein [Sphingomonas sp. M1-B02]|uniref:hypothetical protein n=1 Tax=Sphingomonas sp. M1-B02 TaxID=3114300 RepID=UPI0022407146|nr:hypothetical protein [Sphingomonas sp. S6-11]UZK67805.1 hypothetical protein OKW87_08260 [Sphingomonas sp. S6-11]
MAIIMTPIAMRELLVTHLEGAAGENRAHWERAIGPVEKLPTHLNLHCNWGIEPKASDRDIHTIEQAVALVRAEYPYVAP